MSVPSAFDAGTGAPRRHPRDHRPPGGAARRRHPAHARGGQRPRSPVRRRDARGDDAHRSGRRHGRARGRGRGRGRDRRGRRPLRLLARTGGGHALRRPHPDPPGAAAPGRGRGDGAARAGEPAARGDRAPLLPRTAVGRSAAAPSTTHAGRARRRPTRARPSRRCSTTNRPARVAGIGADSILDVPQQTILLCDLGEAYEATGQHERAQEVYATAIELAEAADDAAGLARAALGLMGGVDESVGFNLTGTDATLVGILDRARDPPPGRRDRASARWSPRGSRAPATTRAKSSAAQELSADALGARAEGRRRAGDRGGAGGPPHRALVSRGARGPAAARRRAAHARSGVLGASRGVAGRRPARVRPAVGGGRGDGGDDARRARRAVSPGRSGTPALYKTMRAQVRGRIDEASAYCEEARRIGAQIGARTAGITYAVQSLFVARERRELDGLAEVLDALAAEHPHQPGFVTTAAWVRVQTGRLEEARPQFEQLAPRFRLDPPQRRVAREHAPARARSRTHSTRTSTRQPCTRCCFRTVIGSS